MQEKFAFINKQNLLKEEAENNEPQYENEEDEIREMLKNAPTKEETIEKWKENNEPDDPRLIVDGKKRKRRIIQIIIFFYNEI